MIYDNIFERAKKRGISINKLEEQAELSKGSICKWGKSVSPTVKSIKKVAPNGAGDRCESAFLYGNQAV